MPDYDFRKLSDEDLLKICNVGEKGVGYKAFQNASALIVRRSSANPKILAGKDSEDFVIDLSDSQIHTIEVVLKS